MTQSLKIIYYHSYFVYHIWIWKKFIKKMTLELLENMDLFHPKKVKKILISFKQSFFEQNEAINPLI